MEYHWTEKGLKIMTINVLFLEITFSDFVEKDGNRGGMLHVY